MILKERTSVLLFFLAYISAPELETTKGDEMEVDMLGIAGTIFGIIVLLVAYVTYRRGYDDGCRDGMIFAEFVDGNELDEIPESA